MANMMVKVRVTGRVQGIGYRYAAAEQAHALELAGWVRNLPDGAVEALICGEEMSVRALIDWMHRGPEMARVDDVSIVPSDETGPVIFQVRR